MRVGKEYGWVCEWVYNVTRECNLFRGEVGRVEIVTRMTNREFDKCEFFFSVLSFEK